MLEYGDDLKAKGVISNLWHKQCRWKSIQNNKAKCVSNLFSMKNFQMTSTIDLLGKLGEYSDPTAVYFLTYDSISGNRYWTIDEQHKKFTSYYWIFFTQSFSLHCVYVDYCSVGFQQAHQITRNNITILKSIKHICLFTWTSTLDVKGDSS